jgi:hypothetical protein
MDIIYLIKMMKKLGKKYKLYIIPGSFCLPIDYPLIKKSPKRQKQFIELKEFVEKYDLNYNPNNVESHFNKENFVKEDDDCNVCNIEVLPQFEYGVHFDVLKKMDIAFGFSCKKQYDVPEGSSKLFDYMCSDLKIIFEDGWNNTKYIEKYKFGKCISRNSTVSEAINAIKSINFEEKSLHSIFIKEHGCKNRAKELIEKI